MISATAVAGVALQYLLGTVLLYWVYTSFGAPIGIGQALVLACVVYLASVVAIVPGNFGFLEMLYLLGGHGLGLPLSGSVALALLLRVSHVAANMLLALIPARDDG
jgi:ABC-type phosphate transport system permease subunit